MLSNLSDNQFMTYPLLHPDRPCLESTKTVSFDSQLQAYDKCISSQHSSPIDLDMSCDFASDNSPEILGNCTCPRIWHSILLFRRAPTELQRTRHRTVVLTLRNTTSRNLEPKYDFSRLRPLSVIPAQSTRTTFSDRMSIVRLTTSTSV